LKLNIFLLVVCRFTRTAANPFTFCDKVEEFATAAALWSEENHSLNVVFAT
jgi:hypothetical protein